MNIAKVGNAIKLLVESLDDYVSNAEILEALVLEAMVSEEDAGDIDRWLNDPTNIHPCPPLSESDRQKLRDMDTEILAELEAEEAAWLPPPVITMAPSPKLSDSDMQMMTDITDEVIAEMNDELAESQQKKYGSKI
jgi:hypothetical protein